MGQKSISLKIRDIQPRQYQRNLYQKSYYIYENLRRQEPVSKGNFEKAVPTKEDISHIYRFLKGRGGYPWGMDLLYVELEKQKINYCKLRLALDILTQLGFIQIHEDGAIALVPGAPKNALENSVLFQMLGKYKNIVP